MSADRIQIPGVVLDEELGRGASSVVYRGRRAGTPCAVKIGRADDRAGRWFRREAVALARVSDPGLPNVMEVGQVGGLPYLVMELVEGETLASRLDRGPLTRAETLEFATRLCRILDAVHRRGLVHRDLKPRNVVLEPSGRVRLVDFGFATIASSTREAAGTRAYAAPEQLRVPTIIDGRADLYALGRVLYECVTGKRPTESQLDPEAELESPLARILAGLVASDPDARYPSAAALMQDLQRLARGELETGPSANVPVPEPLPFIGRDAEVKRLKEMLAGARDGWGGAVLLRGERGSGKSRLLRELAGTASDRGVTFVRTTCEQNDPRPLAALRSTVDLIVAATGPHHPRALARAAGGDLASVATTICPALGGIVETTAPAPPVGAEAFAELATELLARIMRALPTVVIAIDDVQWIDPVSADVFARLAQAARQLPLLLIVAGRGSAGRFADLRDGSAPLPTLDLEPLAPTDVRALATAYLAADPSDAVTAWLASVADGTPLGLTEVLEAMLDAGALEPRDGAWRFDRELAERMRLPSGALALMDRRLRELPEATRRVCEAAAIVGRSFAHDLVAAMVGVEANDLGFAIAQVRRAGLVEPGRGGVSRFVHDSVREALLDALDPAARRALHQRAAETLDVPGADPYALATHYAAGDPERAPTRVIEVAHAAAARALAAFDSEAVLRFFDAAQTTAARTGCELPAELLTEAAEAELRLGLHDDSILHFDAALSRATDALTRARILGRIAWAHQARPDVDAAWAALARAFVELGERMPVESATSARDATFGWLSSWVHEPRVVGDGAERERVEVLCDLHYQNARLGLEYARPLRLVESTLAARTLAQRLGPSPTLARMEALYGTVTTMLGGRSAGTRRLERARRMAQEIANPPASTYCVQLSALAACFTGEFDTALAHLHTLLVEQGHWLELNEVYINVFNAYLIETLRGRPREAWAWLERTIARAARHGRPSAGFLLVAHAARATWTMLRRDDDRGLRQALRIPIELDTGMQGLTRTVTWGSRARYLLERGEVGDELDRLIAEHRAERIDPRRAHPVMAEYYVAIVHARIHRALRAGADGRKLAAKALAPAIADLRAVARYPVLKAHLCYAEGMHAWLRGSTKQASAKLAEAEDIADRETCVWVRFGIERARAHMLREEGRAGAARERARAAAHIARDHGAVHWAGWIHEELGVSVAAGAARHTVHGGRSASRSTSRAQLKSLLEVLRAGAQHLELDEQARVLVDELLETAGADRAFLLFDSDARRTNVHTLGRARDADTWTGGARVQRSLERAIETGLLVTASHEQRDHRADPGSDEIRVITLPLWLAERPAGALHLERDPTRPPFSAEDVDVLVALSYQVPVALELARAMRERTRLEDALRQAQKMEAVGRLVGGIAHDFNNMMMVVISSVTMLLQRRDLPIEVREELQILESAIDRAADLTKQLLSFARRQPRRAEPLDANQVIDELAPMLRRLIAQHVEIRTELWPEPLRVHADRGFFEQALVNLSVNARDAMPDGGTLTLATARVILDESDVRTRPGLLPGPHVCITVRDTGMGMPREVRESAFDPFFTTKDRGHGTGLGLSMVHGFVDQSDGAIEIESEPGRGTLFRIHLPALPAATEVEPVQHAIAAEPPAPRAATPPPPSRNTILIVEDEPRIREVLERVLSDEGYDVLTSGLPEHALTLVDSPPAPIDLVITDILMPGMSGVELAQEIRARSPGVKLLYMSGHAGGELRDLMSADPVAFLEKPFRTDALLTMVRDLLAQ